MESTKKTLAVTAEQTINPDGSITIRPKAVADGREIGTAEAARILGFKDRETVSILCHAGAIRAWKPATRRANGKWRICLQSVIDYREGRVSATRGM